MWNKDGDEKRPYVMTKVVNKGGGMAGAYFLGMIGAAVYWLQSASSFGAGVIGLLKALVWPAYLVYHVLKFVHG